MKRFILMTFCTVAALVAASSEAIARKPVQIRVGSYNLRRAKLDSASVDNKWSVREPRLIQSILDNEFDVCGLQEVDSKEQESVPRMLSERGVEYGSYFFGPYAKDGHGTKAHGIIWRSDRFKLVGEPHHFWLSNPPDQKQVNDFGSDGKHRFIRGAICVILKERKTCRKYCFIVTHAPLNKQQHADNAHIIIEMERKYNPKDLPSFFVGDMNATEKHKASAVYRTHWTDSYHCFDDKPEFRTGPEVTFNGWNLVDPAANHNRIDFIYYRGKGVTPLRYCCNDTRYDGLFASDHFPVWVDFEIR